MTTMPEAIISFAALSMCLSVIRSLTEKAHRNGIAIVSTMAKPDRSAPATKYGGKIVEW